MNLAYSSKELSDRAQIADVIHRYCRAADRRDWSLFSEVFHDDGCMRLSDEDVVWSDFVQQARSVLGSLGPTLHRITNITVDFENGGANCESYITAYHLVLAGEGGAPLFPRRDVDYGVVMGGRYLDRFELREARWRIARRTPAFDWRVDDTAMSLWL